ncbi:MAG: hypothetical protein M1819_003413 [Sarea resinae]|nr:MAG: hypothetical protein M1819_003413 [Sarea resinae]
MPPKKQPMRPPNGRFASSRPQLLNTSSSSRYHVGISSPTNSVASMATSASRNQSPRVQNGALKRKERECEEESHNEETNIHVVVRCRGRNDREVRENSGVVVSTAGVKGKSVELSMGPSALSNKTYHFDKVFSPAADQAMIYEDVVTPILDEMLQGFNCTIFAYGQTGTGKTYTMSGDMSDTLGLLSDAAGIIPRVLYALFNRLEVEEAESSVKCSFIELYNEELRDLLSAEEHAKLKIFDDSKIKGHSTTVVQGMEESHIKSASAGIKLLQDGSYKRQVAATKCNDLSSRSHTVFTITVYTKRTAENGEDYVSAGKLNLVDLAGSENIQRSGAENKRATEAGLINKSLLTLGRVINALVDKGSHIPYRESKLTRLLQDSLGGRTKTCIIATVSPAKSNLEETISTLDYAFRAKNIRNKPQMNQMISKKTLLREFTAEIEKLKMELIATRQRNGVYLSNENFEEITGESESRRILTEEQKVKIETMEASLRNKVQELFSLTSNFNNLKKDNEGTKAVLGETKGLLEKTEFVLANTRQNLAEEAMLRRAHESTEEELNTIGSELISTLGKTVTDVGGLQAKLRRRSDLQALNRSGWKSSQSQVSEITQLVEMRVEELKSQQEGLMNGLSARMQGFVQEELNKLETSKSFLEEKVQAFSTSESEVNEQTSKAKDDMNEVLEEIKVLREDVQQKVGEGLNGLSAAAERISAEVISELDGFHTQLHMSYSTLGKDFRSIFDDLVKNLRSQKLEIAELSSQLSAAGSAAMQANASASSHLERVLNEEKAHAAKERKNLLAQITSLVTASGEAQDARLTSKIDSVKEGIAASTESYEEAEGKYSKGIMAWCGKEDEAVEEVLKARETLKNKLKTDWTIANEHNTSIGTATKAVHQETIRIVDNQMEDITTQMAALDEFVARARAQNGLHHKSHVSSLANLGINVRASYDSIGAHFTTTYDRIREVGTDVAAKTAAMSATLPPLDTNVREPLEGLRRTILNTRLEEYEPTGDTPQKIQYRYPTTLPRTETHELLLSKLRNPPLNAKSPESVQSEDYPMTEDLETVSEILPVSPTKNLIFTDSKDDDDTATAAPLPQQPSADGRPMAKPRRTISSTRAASAASSYATAATNSSSDSKSSSSTSERNGFGFNSLREIDVNVQDSSNPFPSTAFSRSLSASALLGGAPMTGAAAAKWGTKDKEKDAKDGIKDKKDRDMQPPPLKRRLRSSPLVSSLSNGI